MFFSKALRNSVLARLSGMKERDEREVQIVGSALKSTYLSSMTILLCLLSISFIQVTFSKKYADNLSPVEQRGHQSYNPDIETQKYLNTLTPEQKEKSDAYYEGNYWITLWGFCFSAVYLIFILLIQPVFIAPIFNKYKPMENGEIKEQILSMARANSVPVDNVYEFNISKQTNRISANVRGIGSTIRISLNDNLLNQGTPAEIKIVMAHELSHYVLYHVYKLARGVLYIGFNLFML
jgi:Zn-dependent protease with chaperone function